MSENRKLQFLTKPLTVGSNVREFMLSRANQHEQTHNELLKLTVVLQAHFPHGYKLCMSREC